ncbi:aminopeptidase P family protein [Solimonas flava]|uniref:aminopeptidase P family protein n=1 Tax=Solimonas flava TaxID=415849 RepID=UPI0003FBF2EC|nr:aminopeptidase P family protein [Solimonas flava]
MSASVPALPALAAAEVDTAAARLAALRAAMARHKLAAYVVPHDDEYRNEYLPPAHERLAFISGFTGSAGVAAILRTQAALFVDGRYTLQARHQVDAGAFELLPLDDEAAARYVGERLARGERIGFDPRLHSARGMAALRAAAYRAGGELVAVDENLVDTVWGAARPPRRRHPVEPQPPAFSGETSAAKRARLAAQLAAGGLDALLVAAPASLAWLFNVRGRDVPHTPLALGRAILHRDGRAELFVDAAACDPALRAWLGDEVSVREETALASALAALSGRRVLVDGDQASAWLVDALRAARADIEFGSDPCVLPRACKNAVEIDGARRAHERDGLALSRFLHWFDGALQTRAPAAWPDELEIAARLQAFRAASGLWLDHSFPTIAAAGANAAIVHYRPQAQTNRRVQPGEFLLLDSGAQYRDGTTDVTRTIACGTPDARMRRRYTLVLKGHIALARARFPAGTPGFALDALARAALWADGLDYDHGTGHGVGSYLSVHEGPQRIAKVGSLAPLRAGMIVSNEPGYYSDGGDGGRAYGIRIENLVLVGEACAVDGGERPMHGFETLTLAPIDRRCIDAALLEAGERAWLDDYHARVRRAFAADADGDFGRWLEAACAPL